MNRRSILVGVAFAFLLLGFKNGVNGNDRSSQFGDKNTNVDDAYEKVNLRRTRSHPAEEDDELVPTSVLKSSKVDVAVLNSMGSAELAGGVVDRKRRDQAEVDLHAQRAESDAIAAAAESAAAEADAVAAAIEATEIESANENENGVSRHFSRDFADNGVTFEENDNGDNVVVLEHDDREKQHTRGSGGDYIQHHVSDSQGTAEFDVHGNSGNGVNRGHIFQSHTPDESYNTVLKTTDPGGASEIADVKTPINELLSESSGLAKEIRLIFQVLARREDYLVQEMEKLKVALQNAIKALQESNNEAKVIRKRRENDPNPYKACVYINPPTNAENFAPPESLIQNRAQPPTYEDDQMPSSAAQTGGSGDDEIDLSSVYWLKLPENQDEGILQKVHQVLSGIRNSGKDVLFIPVTKGYISNEDVAKGFLRAVRVNPAYATSSDSKQRRRRKRLRLRIRRI